MSGPEAGLIYHIAFDRDWRTAQATGAYRMSTRGRTLEDEGFIHCSSAAQVAAVGSRFYADVPGLVLLTIDPARLRSEVRYEAIPGTEERFPHVYGPLDTDAVVRVEPYRPGPTF
ncbi:MAG TPA: DUF952 domain-containing protein [Terriglobales bacterium]|nr:DUF952 domain-containing protein [Terriglobales bacterium]